MPASTSSISSGNYTVRFTVEASADHPAVLDFNSWIECTTTAVACDVAPVSCCSLFPEPRSADLAVQSIITRPARKKDRGLQSQMIAQSI